MKLLRVVDDLFVRRPIVRQLALLRKLLIGGFSALAVVYFGASFTQMWFIDYNDEINAFRENVVEIEKHTFETRRHQTEFLHLKQKASIEKYKEADKALSEHVSEALVLAPDEESRDKVVQVEKAIREYKESFAKMVKVEVNLGLDENSGLHGALREAVHNIESIVTEVQDNALLASMLMMRRHEKDFIQRIDEQYLQKMGAEKARFDSLLGRSSISLAQKSKIMVKMNDYQKSFQQFFEGMMQVEVENETSRAVIRKIDPLVLELAEHAKETVSSTNTLLHVVVYLVNFGYGIALLIIGFAIVSGLIVVSRSIANPLGQMLVTIDRLAGGEDGARAQITAKNEFGQLGTAFDNMMDDRVATQNAIRRENEQLNDSVLRLLQAVAQLARKDLTIKIPVTEDVTGPVADALNLLTSETGKVLQEVTDISADVTAASMRVKEQADDVQRVAAHGRREVEQTAESLAVAATTMNQIAELAQECNVSADNAIKTTQQALKAVADTVGGINNTRDTIRETEKRIKRLGERSQEISGVVNLINTIAERTHILALNASMHAASAGEAGRGFAVVADEVQRLAENARQATAQIASLVNNIQVETLDTVNTMNAAIAQVVEGSKLAEHASDRMHQTEQRTSELVSLVQRIAVSSTEQAKVSNELLIRAADIRKNTEETSDKIEQASHQTNNLVEYARSLLGAVRVFKLPG